MKYRNARVGLLLTFFYFSFLFAFAAASGLPDGFVYLEDIIPDVVLDMRYCSEDNFIGRPIDGYQRPCCIISKEAAGALKSVQDELKRFSFGLKVYDAYRPQRAVDHFVRWANNLQDTKMKAVYYPDVEKRNLFSDGYIAKKSGHSRGSTVDLTIVYFDENGEAHELDMGTGFDFFSPRSWPSDPTMKPEQRASRMLLQSVMEKHGFRRYEKEWWHFTLVNEPYPDTYFNFEVR
ncbi:MAG: M15 family metallopeptidase [Deltaproteobacteria bacterium]|nr:M15 family metallopeptidase [Deltaproteobacteria bacterium]